MTTEHASLHAETNTRLESLYVELLPVVYGYARSRLPESDAEDVAAEVFRSALQRLRSDPAVRLERAWFLTVARNLIIDRWRREMKWDGRLAALRRDVDIGGDGAPLGSGDSTDRVLEALDQVASDHRAVLVLRYVDGYTSREIATLLGRSPRAVDSLLARARVALVTSFDRIEV